MTFLDSLLNAGVLNRYQLDAVLDIAQKNNNDIDKALRDAKIDETQIRSAKSAYFGYPQSAPDLESIPDSVFKLIPETAARHYRVVPLGYPEPDRLLVGIVDPGSTEALNAIQFIFAQSRTAYSLVVISLSDFEKILTKYQHVALSSIADKPGIDVNTQKVNNDTSEDDGLVLESATEESEIQDAAAQTKLIADAPAVQAFNVIVSNAIEGNASDIHIEGTEKDVRVRYRVDGDLYTSLTFPKSMHNSLVARVKILCKSMKLDERRKPQDGRFFARIHGRKIDFRVSMMPTFYGEKVVIRILDPEKNAAKNLDVFGFREDHLQMIRRAIDRPYGIILITGPTGSGKSTTLYSMMQEVDREKQNVVSLEDPVEYNLEGMNQSQVQPEIGYTFASGLRSILRQDPDIIMVGEIRDKETAQLAIQAALTGHLVFSTLHTNTAIGAIPRLVDMGVDPYLIPPVLALTMAQRLSKRLNPNIKHREIPVEGGIAQMIEKQFSDLDPQVRAKLPLTNTLYDADPEITGALQGRAAVFEMLEMNRELEELILKDPTEANIYRYARAHGMTTLREDAIMKCMQGIIPFSSVNEF